MPPAANAGNAAARAALWISTPQRVAARFFLVRGNVNLIAAGRGWSPSRKRNRKILASLEAEMMKRMAAEAAEKENEDRFQELTDKEAAALEQQRVDQQVASPTTYGIELEVAYFTFKLL
ncbi:uncharacterized protein IUM83_11851 [Phytophthora cinnamomi]|uniref:uncharacterized protein n=1 Tax=Phytophthora cinnamomi TaxID=4785 RepID=UPI003559800B|nr:hypothetical protein IUM83_11851 [Phytophthora cinnamomi]